MVSIRTLVQKVFRFIGDSAETTYCTPQPYASVALTPTLFDLRLCVKIAVSHARTVGLLIYRQSWPRRITPMRVTVCDESGAQCAAA